MFRGKKIIRYRKHQKKLETYRTSGKYIIIPVGQKEVLNECKNTPGIIGPGEVSGANYFSVGGKKFLARNEAGNLLGE